METDAIAKDKPSNWVPIGNKRDLAALSKLGEEVNELGAIICRAIAQGGLDKLDPETGKPNRVALEEEIADVRALSLLCIGIFKLDSTLINHREWLKLQHKIEWLDTL